MVTAIAQVSGPSFKEIFQEFFEDMIVFARRSAHAGKLASIMRTLGEVTAELHANVAQLANET